MADMEWLRRRSRQIAREMQALPEWERASLRVRLLELGKPNGRQETEPPSDQRPESPAATRLRFGRPDFKLPYAAQTTAADVSPAT